MKKMQTTNDSDDSSNQLPTNLAWLADAPLFIDDSQIERFYDAIVRPNAKEGVTTLEINKESAKEIAGKLGLKASIGPTALLNALTAFLPFLKAEVEVQGEGGGKFSTKSSDAVKLELHPIATPQRQLVQLALHYLLNQANRMMFIGPSELDDDFWRTKELILTSPRNLVFLDLPSHAEAKELGICTTKFIPLAAEQSDGSVVLMFPEFRDETGNPPPPYPDTELSAKDQIRGKSQYWQWFNRNFKPQRSVELVENAFKGKGKINWIDYRLPLDDQGETLHLHFSGGGKFDTGVFAFNLVRRGYEHGMRVVGTLKSGPDMNVLAVYEK
jgi:hypothetical protein